MREKDERKKKTEKKAADQQVVEELTAASTKKKLEEMNLLDDFLFGSVVTYPEIGERFVKSLLKIIFGREFKRLSVTAQKVYYGTDSDLHGARLDVYMEPEENSGEQVCVYDIEPNQMDRQADKKMLPRRIRFYHGKIAARSLHSGADYDKLKNVMVIMIMPYDPFGLNRMVYTVKNRCVEVPEMEYEDGAGTLFLYTKGRVGIPNEAVKQLLRYMEESICENAVNEELREIHRMVETVKKDPEVGGMRIQLVDDVLKLTEEKARLSEENAKMSEENAKMSEENAKMSEENAKMSEENAKMSEENARISEEKAQLEERYAKLEEEIAKLREDLGRSEKADKIR